MNNNSIAAARLAVAVFYRAYLDATNDSSSSRSLALREDAILWIREFGVDFLVIAGVPIGDARRMIAWLLGEVAPVK